MVEELEQNVRPGLVATTEAVTLLHSEVEYFDYEQGYQEYNHPAPLRGGILE